MIKSLMVMGASYLLFNPKGQEIGKEMLKQVNNLGKSILDDVAKEIKNGESGNKEDGHTDITTTDIQCAELPTESKNT